MLQRTWTSFVPHKNLVLVKSLEKRVHGWQFSFGSHLHGLLKGLRRRFIIHLVSELDQVRLMPENCIRNVNIDNQFAALVVVLAIPF